MRVLKIALTLCMIFGCWQPFSWTLLFKHIIYKVYRILLISLLFIFMASQFMNIVVNVSDPRDMTETLYIMLAIFLATSKITFMWINGSNITRIIGVLAEKPFIPIESHEITIRRKYDKIIEKISLAYFIFGLATLLIMILIFFFTKFMNGELIYKAWLPLNYTSPTIFFMVYTQQILGMTITAMVQLSCDILFFGLLMHICCQLDILEHRLKRISHNREILRDCICHHDYIFEYAYRINDLYGNIIGLQFIISTLVACSNLYLLAMVDIEAFIPQVAYAFIMIVEIFFYCWFGNEVTLKSVQLINGIYNMEWSIISNNNKMALLMIMRRSMNAIKFTSGYIFSMNLDSFVSLLKVSYSIYNLLKSNRKAEM